MNKPNRAAYALAQERIRNGDWHIDAERGLVFGAKGSPFSAKRPGRHGGYVICSPDGQHAVLVHRVIWEYATGAPIADDLVINHLNGVKDDNRISNLEMVTQRENNVHAYRIGLLVNKKRAATECATHGLEYWAVRRASDRPGRGYCKECHRLRMARSRVSA